MRFPKPTLRLAGAAAIVAAFAFPAHAADDRAELAAEAEASLAQCKSLADTCAQLAESAAGVLVFPKVTSASLIVGGAGGKGVLWRDGEIAGYYGIGEASVGLQAGFKQASQVFALNDKALARLEKEGSWKIGTDAEVTVIGDGASEESVAGQGGTAVFVFNEEGLSAGASVEGVTINRLDADDFADNDPEDKY